MTTPALKYQRFRRENERDQEDGIEIDLLNFSKDYDRILYSTAFRRLDGVTQVVSANEIALFHNRLTHTLKTAQVGARIANHLRRTHTVGQFVRDITEWGGIDSRVVRAACMAHDLGHPPFGHIGEKELQDLCASHSANEAQHKSQGGKAPSVTIPSARYPSVDTRFGVPDGFEGNAQSFRIVTKLAFREPAIEGSRPALNLTKGTLAAILKYPWARTNRPTEIDLKKEKWGYYDSELEIAKWVFGEGKAFPTPRKTGLRDRNFECRCLEAQIMDWADDISYAVHDVEDFFRAGLIPLDALATSEDEWNRFFQYAWDTSVSGLFPGQEDDVRRWLNEARQYFPRVPFGGSGYDREDLHFFASNIIRDATDGTVLRLGGLVDHDDKQLAIVETLKRLTWYYVIERPSLESIQRGQRYLIRSLYRSLVEWTAQVWEGPRGIKGTRPTGGSGRRQLPARLLDYLEVAFSTENEIGCLNYSSESMKVSRAVIDFIVSLTEVQAFELNAKLTGTSIRSVLEGWVAV